jgi:16S rRNA C967 or C1407 C5-methylase (RsmB/RsmF family)
VLALPGDATDASTALFDRILVDAPCSGDGTIRKEPMVWRRWNVKDGVELHALQLKLLSRAIALLRVGGRLV